MKNAAKVTDVKTDWVSQHCLLPTVGVCGVCVCVVVCCVVCVVCVVVGNET